MFDDSLCTIRTHTINIYDPCMRRAKHVFCVNMKSYFLQSARREEKVTLLIVGSSTREHLGVIEKPMRSIRGG
jgi:hypothetical protein